MSPLQEKNLIEACLRNDRQAQFEMYGFFSVRLMPLCKRYARSNWDADDILQEGFIKAFRYLKDYKSNGSFEGWLRRIMVTTALNFYKRKKITFTEAELNYLPDEEVHEMSVITNMYYDDLEKLVNTLPNGYHNVFKLNVIEGYTHKEIGEMLDISINTSKSQLMRARDQLQRKIVGASASPKPHEILQTA